ncbi:hypothetical protein VIGAN_08287000 [Vigna angularis var. angularis]|uniref:Uncharacterized protein n=1 Tax=Vigna angularis var. angularis TaxID=157739 RepID=A0A0S3ST56_PHAAN|nr:hypothetical protein VIGAN_08287000 [Vigna angularis var. angularis]
MGKPTPKVEVMKYLKSKDYTDAKDYVGECESVVMIAKGQRTSDHHIVKVDVVKANDNPEEKLTKNTQQPRQRVVKITQSTPSKGIWKTHS